MDEQANCGVITDTLSLTRMHMQTNCSDDSLAAIDVVQAFTSNAVCLLQRHLVSQQASEYT